MARRVVSSGACKGLVNLSEDISERFLSLLKRWQGGGIFLERPLQAGSRFSVAVPSLAFCAWALAYLSRHSLGAPGPSFGQPVPPASPALPTPCLLPGTQRAPLLLPVLPPEFSGTGPGPLRRAHF